MAITKSIVELMGGTIEVFSEVDRGTLFRVELELRILEAAADRTFWEQRGISRILAVGGSAESRESILTLMQDAGVPLEADESADQALERIRGGGDFQLVLLDWEDFGLPAVRALREALTESVPIVLLTEFDAEGIEEALFLGRMDVLTKPFFVSALRAVVEELFGEPGGAAEPEPEEDGGLTGMHFLAAEDNEINAEILTDLLEIEGASCEIQANGLLAVERFRRSALGEFDAILMDVQMPVMNGHEAARAIRSLEREDAGRIPIIAMTANAFAEDEKAALDAGMTAHVAKPLNMEHLKSVIAQCTKRKEDGS